MKQFFSDPKKRTAILLTAGCVLLTVILAILILPGFLRSKSGSGTSKGNGSGSGAGSFEDVKQADTSAFTDLSKMQADGAVTFTFTDSVVTANQNSGGYEISGTALKITESGTYVLSGSCADGSVTVAKETADVFLILDGLQLTSSTGPALTCNKSSSVCIYLQPDSENFLADPSVEHEEGAALKFKSGAALTLCGEGSLTVSGNSKNGIKGGAGSILKIVSGTFSVTAQNNALACDHYMEINGGTLILSAQNDGIKSSPDEGDTVSAGNIMINGGTVTVDAVGDGLSADGLLSVSGGTVSVKTTGEVSASIENGFGGMGGFFPGGWRQSATSEGSSSDASSKGVKAGTAMKITGGDITVSSTDHALHCSGETVIEGGTLTLSSSVSKGISVHGDLTVSGNSTEITVENATEGIESKMSFTVNGGSIRVLNASDDAINLGGTVSSADVSSHALTVNDGYLYLYGAGDCVDSNGTITFNGGTAVILGPSRGGNSCLDCQYGITYNGGTVLGIASSNSMWSEDVIRNIDGKYVYHLSAGNVSQGETVSAVSSDGDVLASAECPFSGQIGVIFLTDRADTASCTFVLGGALSDQANDDDCRFSGDISGGTTVTPSEGTGTSGGMGGGMPGDGFDPGGGDHGGGPGGMPGGRR